MLNRNNGQCGIQMKSLISFEKNTRQVHIFERGKGYRVTFIDVYFDRHEESFYEELEEAIEIAKTWVESNDNSI